MFFACLCNGFCWLVGSRICLFFGLIVCCFNFFGFKESLKILVKIKIPEKFFLIILLLHKHSH